MPDTVTIRFNKEEKKLFESAAKLYDCSVGAMIKRLAIEKLEDEMDFASIQRYENDKLENKLKVRPIEDFWSELDIDE